MSGKHRTALASIAAATALVLLKLVTGYADITVTVALIVLPFIVGFQGHTTALVFYLIVGAGGLGATLATRFEARMPAEREMMVRMAA